MLWDEGISHVENPHRSVDRGKESINKNRMNQYFHTSFYITFVGNQQKLFRLSMVCLPLIHLLIILFLFSLPISMFHFCELVCSLLYSSMNLLALVVVKFVNMLLCFYLNSSLLYASSRIRTLNKLYKYFLP